MVVHIAVDDDADLANASYPLQGYYYLLAAPVYIQLYDIKHFYVSRLFVVP